MDKVNLEIAKAGGWMVGLKWFVKLLGILSTLILARVLLPEDFGLVATAMIFVSLLTYMGEFGLDSALIQNSDRSAEIYNTAWTFNLIMGIGQAVLSIIFAGSIAVYFNDERLVDIIYLLAFTFVLKGAKNIGIVEFRKDMQFHNEFILMAVAKLFSFVVTVGIALYYQTYWALIFGVVVSYLTEFILSYTMHPFRPNLTLRKLRKLFSFSQWLYLAGLTRYLAIKGPNFMLAKYAGPAQLGIFTIGYEIGSLPTVELMSPINRALFPAFSKLIGDKKLLRSTYLDSSSVLALLIIPAGLGMSAIADILIPTAIGEQWMEAIPVVILIGALGAFRGMYANTSAVYLALGKPNILVYQSVLWLAMLLPACYFMSIHFGSLGVAFAFLVTDLIMLPVRLSIIVRLLQFRPNEWASTVVRPLYAALFMYLAIYGMCHTFAIRYTESMTTNIMYVVLLVAIGAVVYSAFIYILWVASKKPYCAEKRIFDLLLGLARKRET